MLFNSLTSQELLTVSVLYKISLIHKAQELGLEYSKAKTYKWYQYGKTFSHQ